MLLCLACKQPNPDGHNYCSNCGAILDNITLPTHISTSVEEIPVVSDTLQPLIDQDEDQMYFGRHSRVVLLAQSRPIPLEFGIPESTGIVLGRLSSQLLEKPFIDLSFLGGFKLGISRLHAELRLHGQSLHIKDLESTNGTFVNGFQVQPRKRQRLANGDTLQLGKLVLRVLFRHAD